MISQISLSLLSITCKTILSSKLSKDVFSTNSAFLAAISVNIPITLLFSALNFSTSLILKSSPIFS